MAISRSSTPYPTLVMVKPPQEEETLLGVRDGEWDRLQRMVDEGLFDALRARLAPFGATLPDDRESWTRFVKAYTSNRLILEDRGSSNPSIAALAHCRVPLLTFYHGRVVGAIAEEDPTAVVSTDRERARVLFRLPQDLSGDRPCPVHVKRVYPCEEGVMVYGSSGRRGGLYFWKEGGEPRFLTAFEGAPDELLVWRGGEVMCMTFSSTLQASAGLQEVIGRQVEQKWYRSSVRFLKGWVDWETPYKEIGHQFEIVAAPHSSRVIIGDWMQQEYTGIPEACVGSIIVYDFRLSQELTRLSFHFVLSPVAPFPAEKRCVGTATAFQLHFASTLFLFPWNGEEPSMLSVGGRNRWIRVIGQHVLALNEEEGRLFLMEESTGIAAQSLPPSGLPSGVESVDSSQGCLIIQSRSREPMVLQPMLYEDEEGRLAHSVPRATRAPLPEALRPLAQALIVPIEEEGMCCIN